MVYDNADFNIQTLDGRNTFHTMGGIRCVTPKNAVVPGQKVARLKDVPSAQIVGSLGAVPLKHFERNNDVGLAAIHINDLSTSFPHTETIVPSVPLLLWLYSKSKNLTGMSGWNGFMEEVTKEVPYQTTFIDCQPFINAPPGEYDTIYTSLLSAVEKTHSLGQRTTFVTFDQPLYLKARDVIASRVGDPELPDVVIRLGGFHSLMSFMGAVGYIMEGSGLSELFNTVYSVNSTEKVMTGHAYARAIRGHTLAFRALGTVIMESLDFSPTFQFDVEQLLYSGDRSELLDAHERDCGKEISQKFETQLQHLANLGPTSKLWIEYFQMITLVLKFIESERMGNWKLHLQVIHDMLPYFHASGHYLYAKCAHLYLQDMLILEHSMPPDEFQAFTSKGGFTIRRSDKCWCGTWRDMCIEQQLMKHMKVEGGLSRARGFSEGILARWTLGMSSLQHVANAIEDFCGVNFGTTDQHADSRDARVNLDNNCTKKMLEWFHQHPPFPDTSELISISNGVVGRHKINCHLCREVGTKGIKGIVGNDFKAVKFKRTDRVLPLATISSAILINDQPVVIKPTTLFQRMVVAKQSEEELEDFLTYELAPYPLALFDEGGMRKGTKSALYKAFKPLPDTTLLDSSTVYVIDGGFLLHRVVWSSGHTFEQICDSYIHYVRSKYNQSATIVFDGYSDGQKSTKSMERLRRSTKKQSVEIQFSSTMTPTVSQVNFLSNAKNKDRLITMLMTKCNESGIASKQAADDADTLIVRTAESLASAHKSVAIVGEDVDLLVIMMDLQTPPNVYFLKPGRGKAPQLLYHPGSAVEKSVANYMLFLHAMSGCDSTSALFNQGKVKFLKTLSTNLDLESYITKFTDPSAHPKEITAVGEKFLIALYGGNHPTTTLYKVRYKQYVTSAYKASANTASIPPTEAAAQQHAFRVFHQVQQWIGNYLDPEQWGWKLTENGLVPITTLKPPAPERLLQLISCKCKTDCQGRCGCRRAGLFCTKLCQQCEGSCSNIDDNLDAEEEDDLDEPLAVPLSEAAEATEGINSCNILQHYASLLISFSLS